MELRTKREAESSAAAAAAAKRARTTEVVISGNDEILPDRVSEPDEEAPMQTDRSTTEETGSDSDDEVMPDRESEQDEEASKRTDRGSTEEEYTDEELMLDRLARKDRGIDIVRELQLFFQSQGHSDRAKQISSAKHACKLFTKVEMDNFMKIYKTKHWHIRLAPYSGTDYQRLSIYLPNGHINFCSDYCHYHFTYDFDLAYLDFAKELWESVTWETTKSDARPIAEAIWKKHMPYDVQSELLDDCISMAVKYRCAKKSAEELGSLCFDLYRREMDGKSFVESLKEIIAEKGIGSYPVNKAFIEEAFEKQEGCIWTKYRSMKRSCKIEEGGALKEHELKDLITNRFEYIADCVRRDYYSEYVNEKIRFAKELGIV